MIFNFFRKQTNRNTQGTETTDNAEARRFAITSMWNSGDSPTRQIKDIPEKIAGSGSIFKFFSRKPVGKI